jgi:hypothetical protein
MKKRSIPLTILVSIGLIFSQCKTSHQHVVHCKKLILNESYVPKQSGILPITNQRITCLGNQLILLGDQITSNCALIWDGKMAKSYPPIVFLHLEQKGQKKAKRNTCFDISELVERTGKTPVRLQIAGFEQEILLGK